MSMTYDACQVPAKEGQRPSVKRATQFLAGWFAGQVDALRVYLRTYLARRERRDAFCALLDLDDRRLRDIGVSRAAVEWAVRLPLSVDAASELRKIAACRR